MGWHSLAQVQVPLPIHTDIPARFSDSIHHSSLIHHVPLSERDGLFEVVGEEFASDVYPADEESAAKS